MNLKLLILAILQDGKRRISRTSTDLQQHSGWRIFFTDLAQDGKLLRQPLAVLEEIRLVVLVKCVPPFLGVIIEALAVKVGDGVLPLPCVLLFRELLVGIVDGYVVPGVEFEDVVAFFEVA
jgi:hypothetical protein